MMYMLRNTLLTLLISVLLMNSRDAISQTLSWKPISATATFETGDSWSSDGVAYRLFGVQSCLRGSKVVGADGSDRDCGELSMMMLIRLVGQWHPLCYPVSQSADGHLQLVICSARVTSGPWSGSVIDLGTALISSGFAFAALNANGSPVNNGYRVSQMIAKKGRKGLWSLGNLHDPNEIIMRNLGAGDASDLGQKP